MEKKGFFAQNFNLITVLIIPVAIAINFVGAQLVSMLRIPIYLDCIGTVLIGIIAGPWVGLFTGFLSISVNSIADPTAFPYSVVGAVVGCAAGILSMKGMFSNVWKTLISGIILALCATMSAAPITLFVFGGSSGQASSIVTLGFLASGLELVKAVFSAELITDLIDKILSAFLCFFIIKSISSRYLSKFRYGSLYIKKKSNPENTEVSK
jgi:energy-coupling factor transport system substrate-specific component